ncbi:ligase-associated DNA damage response endonuclease PdeM [Sphingomonas sp. TX0543]|uniref:ligase-associated DNA damage response endonuclease PdeM n=1 Tax=unclassified Sphingomonas TaxID=196159 RepID=UPI0010FA3BDB|nr:ligase-associated DNA damage response endonuclease PdeM [Sphingomonas sp. 3P27F8]
MVPFSFAGHNLIALQEGALFWPARKALLVADLHLEKASSFARAGQMLPPYDSIATLTDLTALATATDAREIWCLGDSFHDVTGGERLTEGAREMLAGLMARTRWIWITGNHDPVHAERRGGEILAEAMVDGLLLRHEADPADQRPELSGHFHPRLRIRVRGRLVSRRCFVASHRKIVLPAFGALTGGLDATHSAIARALGDRGEALVPVENRLLRFPLAA